MDIIGHLERTVTPAVLGESGSTENKNLLEQFYVLFASKLADNDTYDKISRHAVNREDLGLFSRLWSDDAERVTITKELAVANNVEESAVKGLVLTAAPLAFNEISSIAGTTPVPEFLQNNLDSFSERIPAWATALLPAGLLGLSATALSGASAAAQSAAGGISSVANSVTDSGANAAAHVKSIPTTKEAVTASESNGGFLKALLPVIGLIILGALAWALLKGCQDKPEPVGMPVENMEQTAEGNVAADVEVDPASLTLATGAGDDLLACRIYAGDENLASGIKDAVTAVFATEADKCRVDINDDYATDMPAMPQLAKILPLLKGTPNANVIIKGDEVHVDAPDSAQLEKLVADLQAASPDLNIIADGELDLDSEVQASIDAANAAMDKLGNNPDPKDVARALSLQVINFDSAQAEIPEVNKQILNRAVAVMQKVPDMKLNILGHTDSQGDAQYNVELSQQRAQAVKDYMVAQGADESKLMIKGMGEADPIATNETEQGRFRNRRIEFIVYDETMDADETIAVTQNAQGEAEVEVVETEASETAQ